MFQLFNRLLLVMTFVAVSACSTTQMAYNNADWLVMYEIDGYFDVSEAQEAFLEPRLDEFFCWHRHVALPDYVKLLEEMTHRAERPLSHADLGWFFTQVEWHRRQMLERVLPDMAQFLSTLSEAQLQHFSEELDDYYEETRELLAMSHEERLEARAERTMDILREWFGRFDSEQIEKISALSKASPETREIWYKFQRERQEVLIELIRSKPTPAMVETQLRRWWLTNDNAYPVSFRNRESSAWQGIESMLLAIDKLLTPKQRQHFIDTLNEYKDDFSALHEKNVCPAPTNAAIDNNTPPGS